LQFRAKNPPFKSIEMDSEAEENAEILASGKQLETLSTVIIVTKCTILLVLALVGCVANAWTLRILSANRESSYTSSLPSFKANPAVNVILAALAASFIVVSVLGVLFYGLAGKTAEHWK